MMQQRDWDATLAMLSDLILFKNKADALTWRDAFENMDVYMQVLRECSSGHAERGIRQQDWGGGRLAWRIPMHGAARHVLPPPPPPYSGWASTRRSRS